MANTNDRRLSDAIYENALQQAGSKPTYAGTYEDQLSSIFDKIQNREKFNYDVNADPLYQSYKDQYIQGGKLAMKDTMGQAAALTGGYGNTYGQQVGQQAYNAYLQNLSAVIPELYGMAYDRYRDEGDDLKDQYAMAGDLRDKEYDRFRNELGDWERDRAMALENERYEREYSRQEEQEAYNRQQTADEIARQLENQEYNRRIYSEEVARELENRDYTRRMAAEEVARKQEQEQYDRRMAAEAIARQLEQQEYNRRMQEQEIARQQEQQAYNRRMQEQETAYKERQQAYSNLYAMIKASGYRPTDAELAAAGMTRAAADALAAEYTRSITPTYSSGSGGSGSGSGSGSSRSSGGSRSNGLGYDGINGKPVTIDTIEQFAEEPPRFTVDNNGDLIFTGSEEDYYNLSDKTKQAAEATVYAQEKGKSTTNYYNTQEQANITAKYITPSQKERQTDVKKRKAYEYYL